MKVKHGLLGLAMIAVAVPATAMDAETFYTKGVALKTKGVGALFSSDLKRLENRFIARPHRPR
jgi:hypothetical protein